MIMGKKLVIVESPAKAKTINKILGADFVVRACMGHVRDLPQKQLGVDVENDFKPKYVVADGKKKVLSELKEAFAACDSVYLAPDPDREGEAIAWHLREVLQDRKAPKPFVRVQYNEITARAVKKAFDNPGEIDEKRVNAQQARRILDRIVGYTVSPMLWRRVERGTSAGRVQSVALRLVCEREKEILSFKPEEFWLIGAKVRKFVDPLDPFRIRLLRINDEKADIKTAADAERIRKDIDGRALQVADVTIQDVRKNPYPPHITSTLQQAASTVCGYPPKRTMSIAQKLYEGVNLGDGPVGLITYMRTDSFTVSQDALGVCREMIVQDFGADYCPEKPNYYKSRGNAQEAHEAIRPTDVRRTPDSLRDVLNPEEFKVYSLVWMRFVASQMTPAVIERRTVKVDALPGEGQSARYLFQASASEIKFPGYMKVTGADVRKKEKEEEEEEENLPALSTGEKLECLEWLEERKETQPPRRYSEASLIRQLEANGVGRPSTYAQIISTLMDRRYAVRDNKAMVPTPLGMRVNDLLVSCLGELFDVNFTAAMEGKLDDVEAGGIGWVEMLTNFYQQFSAWMQAVKDPSADMEAVRGVLDGLKNVKEWAPEVKKGKRTYGDRLFVDSVRQQMDEGKKAISERQLQALLGTAASYGQQVPELEALVRAKGRDGLWEEARNKPTIEQSARRLELLAKVTLNTSADKFVTSLRTQAERGRQLSHAQVAAMDRILVSHSDQVPDFEKIRAELGIQKPEATSDTERGGLIEAIKAVTQWRPAGKRGKREFDDQKFIDSLSRQFAARGGLSDKQRAALKKVIGRYKDQIPNFEALAEKYGIAVKR
jgi:DNA topoisomerase-1